MLAVLPTASLYGENFRLLAWLLPLALFVVLLPRPAPRPLALAALGAVVGIWDFGSALIWATGYATKVRFSFVLEGTFGSWLLLACAVAGTLAAAGAARAFAHHQQRAGLTLSATFGVAFVVWSSAVRYSPAVAFVGLMIAGYALWSAGKPLTVTQATAFAARPKYRGTLTGLVWAGSVLAAGIAFVVWAQHQTAPFGQSCPFGMPGQGHPLLVGALTALGANLVILGVRRRSHPRNVLVALGLGAVCAVGFVDLVGWFLVGVSHYCTS